MYTLLGFNLRYHSNSTHGGNASTIGPPTQIVVILYTFLALSVQFNLIPFLHDEPNVTTYHEMAHLIIN